MSIRLHWNLHLFIVNIDTFWANIFRVIVASNCTNVQWPERCQLCLAPDCDCSFIQNPYPISMQVPFSIQRHYFFQNKEDLRVIFRRDCHSLFNAWKLWQEPVASCVDSYTSWYLALRSTNCYFNTCMSWSVTLENVGLSKNNKTWQLYMFESSTKKYYCESYFVKFNTFYW